MPEKLLDYDDDLTEAFVGRRIIKAELGVDRPSVESDDWLDALVGTAPYGRLTLDDDTIIYLVGHDGGCACSAGCYELTHLAEVDNIITDVRVVDLHAGDDSETDEEGRYQIFVVTEAEELKIAEFEGSDGNGFYGTGFHLLVKTVA
jgi:hypothetical protein